MYCDGESRNAQLEVAAFAIRQRQKEAARGKTQRHIKDRSVVGCRSVTEKNTFIESAIGFETEEEPCDKSKLPRSL
jgi:hypothetical protein